ncbi:MAG TPA: hypothetical protein VME92_20600 [Acetobacteraceae bacterium]|nr:hypothetical protein [Acetobacteraceae bacterium]
MTETMEPTGAEPDEVATLRARADALERQLREAMDSQQDRLLRAELKAEAVRAGMVDLDGLKLVDLSKLRVSESGEVEGAAMVMHNLRRSKPWLFGGASSSSAAAPPPSTPPRQKLATEMNEDEWRAARAELLRRR